MIGQEFLSRLSNVRRSGAGFTARCPAHDDRHNSLSISNGDNKVLLHCHAGCQTTAIVDALGLDMRDLFGEKNPSRSLTAGEPSMRIAATYDYTDEQCNLLYQVVRYVPKGFAARRPDGNGYWTWNLNGVRRVLYHLPDLAASHEFQPVFVVEGEKNADRLKDLGFPAVTNAGGAKKWLPEYSEMLRGRCVYIIPDNDPSGREHAAIVADSLIGVAHNVKVVQLPGLPPKGDVSDFLRAGRSTGELLQLCESAPELGPDKNHNRHLAKVNDYYDFHDGPVDLATLPEPGPTTYVVEDFIPEGYTTNLYGDSGQGKSYLGLHLALCIVTGEPFMNREVRKGPVLYLDWELDQTMQRRRWGEVTRGKGYDTPPYGLHYRRMKDSLLDSLDSVYFWLDTMKPVLTVIDSVGKALGDDPLDHRRIINLYTELDALGTVLCLDHQPKANDLAYSARTEFGSSYKRHLARSSWQLERVGGDGGKVGLMLRHKKSNFGQLCNDVHAVLTFEGDELKTLRLELANTPDEMAASHFGLRAQVLKALKRQQSTAQGLAAVLPNFELGSIKNELTALKQAGLVVVVSKSGRERVYGLKQNHNNHNPLGGDDYGETQAVIPSFED